MEIGSFLFCDHFSSQYTVQQYCILYYIFTKKNAIKTNVFLLLFYVKQGQTRNYC